MRYVALDFQVNHQNATSPSLEQYRFIHFSTHGLLDSKQPELSGVFLSLWDRDGRFQEDGILRLGEVYSLKLNADVVTLSACETALGRQVDGEGIIGLTRGFMYAGSRSVVASLWLVDDKATSELMKSFYAAMLGPRHLAPAAALRQAQIEFLLQAKQTEQASPYYWASFVHQGLWPTRN
jgi:CHAT domain-containing protein